MKLWIFQKDICAWMYIWNLHDFNQFHIDNEKNGIYISFQNKRWKLIKRVIIDDTLFILESKESQIAILEGGHFTIGRDISNDLCIQRNNISNYHAKIEDGLITDLDSLNGTYVNGKRIHLKVLEVKDEIVVSTIRFIYLKNYIVIDMVDNTFSSNFEYSKSIPIKKWIPHTFQMTYPTVQTFDIDVPVSFQSPKKAVCFRR